MKQIITIWAAVMVCTATASAQTEVTAGVMRGKDYGVTYTLPKSEIRIEVKVNKVIYTPGEFSRYADRYLRLNNVSGEPEEYWELQGMTVQSAGVPDSEKTYFVKLKDKTVAPLMELTKEGIVKSINMPYSSPSGSAASSSTPASTRKVNPKDFLTEEILMANSTAKMAELISKEIYNIRESRNALMRGQADYMSADGEQMKLMLTNLEEQERAMTEMFSGTCHIEERAFVIRVVPDREYDEEVVFRFSRKLGLLGKEDLAGEPIYMTLKDLNAVDVPEDDKKKKVSGVAYNIPGRARVTIKQGTQQLYSGEMPITQFGTTEYLAPALFNKKSTVKVLFNPETGGLIKVDRDE